MLPLSSVSLATAAELFASLLVKYRLVATSMHSKAPDKMIRRARMVKRKITLGTSSRRATPSGLEHPQALPPGDQQMSVDEFAASLACYLNKVTLITAPRSPSLPPSRG